MNKKKIINDPIYGFITIPGDLTYEVIEHRYFQKLRRIKQLGLADYTYPGALHTRFHHALGAMHLMGLALTNIQSKGHLITDDEFLAAQLGVLLHDVGHGPYSHALEHTLLHHTQHENISLHIIEALNQEFKGALDLTLSMFKNTYPRKFFHQLISSQLDIDRLDYLQRDSFFTGVSEGTIGAHRIIKMLEIFNDEIVVEEKGIYSIENFLNVRRLMYWQVYLHKKVLSAEKMIIRIMERARLLLGQGISLQATPALLHFLSNRVDLEAFQHNNFHLHMFSKLDDYDVMAAVKNWCDHRDRVLSLLCQTLLDRKLFKVEITQEPVFVEKSIEIEEKLRKQYRLSAQECAFLTIQGVITNEAYQSENHTINIIMKNGQILDIAQASDLPNIKALSRAVKKHYICWPKDLNL